MSWRVYKASDFWYLSSYNVVLNALSLK